MKLSEAVLKDLACSRSISFNGVTAYSSRNEMDSPDRAEECYDALVGTADSECGWSS